MKALGLDLGTNSIGWALLSGNPSRSSSRDPVTGEVRDVPGFDPQDLISAGSRIFQDPLDPQKKVPLNTARRGKRALRKIISRRRKRKQALLRLLLECGLLPKDPIERTALLDDHTKHPYILRKKGLDDELTLHEFGRVLFHLWVRRGFKSNRKAAFSFKFGDPDVMAVLEEEEREGSKRGEVDEDDVSEAVKASNKDTEQVRRAIGELKSQMAEVHARTLGEYFALEIESGRRARRTDGETANTERSQYEDEFELLWAKQQEYHPRILTERLKARIFQIIFFQRPLKVQRFLKERCPFEPGRLRAMKAHPVAQEFRIWQTLNNIRIREEGSRAERQLSREEKQAALQKKPIKDSGKISGLLYVRTMTWAGFRKQVGIRNAIINLEEGGEKTIKGHTTAVRLRSILNEKWDLMPSELQDRLVHDMLNIDLKDGLVKRLRGPDWAFTPKEAYLLATTELEPGTASLSVKAMKKLLPHLKAGLRYDEACQAVGYLRRDQRSLDSLDELPEPPDPRNPVVKRCLFELRKVVNTIIRVYGKPDFIHIELAREIKLTKKQKEAVEKQNRINRTMNERARAILRTHPSFIGVEPKSDDLEKYRLWEECDQTCPFTGKPIPLATLYSQDCDVEHIIPYSRCYDDSFRNKTVCDAMFNRTVKKGRTPRETFTDPIEFEKLRSRVESTKMKRGKKQLFEKEWTEEDNERFLSRQLSDTAYISRLAKEYLRQLGIEPQVGNGAATATLRRKWGLNDILGDTGEKNRNDHRHHAIDAIVIALTSRSLYQKLSTLSGKVGGAGLRDHDLAVPEPFPDFRKRVVDVVESIIVSHQVTRKITGALHEDTGYGKVAPGVYSVRKSIPDLTDRELAKVCDPHLRALIEPDKELRKNLDPNRPLVITDRWGREKVIRRVKITVNKEDDKMFAVADEFGNEYRFHPKGSNHHVEVFENADGERWYEVVSTIDAARRAAKGKPVVNREAKPGWRLVMVWHANDTVRCQGLPHELYRIVKYSQMRPGVASVMLRPLNSASESSSAANPKAVVRHQDCFCQSHDAAAVIVANVNIDAIGRER